MAYPHASPYPDFFAFDKLLTDEQRLVAESLRSFISEKAEPLIPKAYEEGRFPTELIPGLAALGVLGAHLDGYGLAGLDPIAYGLIMRELERCDSGLRSFASVQGSLVMYPIHAYGSEEQKQQWLPRMGRGEAIGCFGLTEANGGSDPSAMQTRAEKSGEGYLLSGSKMWITNGNLAEVAVVWAKCDEGIAGFLVPLNSPGVTVKEMKGKLSLRASITSELYFDKVKLTEKHRLPKAKGIKAALSCLTQARYGIAWGAIGAAESCFDEVVRYTKDRILFQKPLAASQLIQKKLATLCTEITQAQLLALRLGQLKAAGELHPAQVSMAKQANVEMALRSSRVARDMLGANGIMLEYKSMRHMCNLESVFTYEGTNDIHSLIVGQAITGLAAYS